MEKCYGIIDVVLQNIDGLEEWFEFVDLTNDPS